MKAFRYLPRPDRWPSAASAPPGDVHEVEIDGDDFAARCGERWSRRADGGIVGDDYNGAACQPCKGAP